LGRPFNFFQFNTGVLVPTGGGGSGLAVINPLFEQLLSGEGMYTPPDMIKNPDDYIFSVYSEATDTQVSNQVSPYGKNYSTSPHNVSFLSSVSGKHYPVLRESGTTTNINISGSISGDSIDKYNYSMSVSGAISGDSLDRCAIINRISGKQIRGAIDKTNLNFLVTGDIKQDNIDKPSYYILVSGNVVKYEKNRALYSVQPNAITWDRGYVKVSEESGHNLGMQVDFYAIYWNSA